MSQSYPALHFQLLGPLVITINGKTLPKKCDIKAQLLLVYLALHQGSEVKRDAMLDLLWSNSASNDRLYNVRRALSALRKGLDTEKERLIYKDAKNGATFDVNGVKVDVFDFEKCIQAGNWDDAVTLYRGEFLEGHDDAGEEKWIDWLRGVREKYREQCETAHRNLCKHALASGNYIEALRHLNRLASVRALPQELWQQLLTSVLDDPTQAALAGDIAQDIRRHARRAEVDMSPSLQQLLRKVRYSAPVKLPKRNLPRYVTELVGRKDEAMAIETRLQRFRLVTLTGIGGIGKTHLSVVVAERVLHNYLDGLAFVDLASLSDGALLAQTVAGSFALREDSRTPIENILVHYLQKRKLLLILDNCEHLLDACALFVQSLLVACPSVTVLATSRQALGLQAETVYSLDMLPYPDRNTSYTLGELMAFPSVSLFVNRATALRSDFTLCAENQQAIVSLCHALDGVPLALELAANYMQGMTAAEVYAQIITSASTLKNIGVQGTARHQSLTNVLESCRKLLTPPAQTLLYRCSIFSGTFSALAVEALWNENTSLGRALPWLLELVSKSLIRVDTQGQESRYRLHETVRWFAGTHLAAQNEQEEMAKRHSDYFQTFCQEVAADFYGPHEADALARFVKETDNLRAALAWCKQNDVRSGLKFIGTLWFYWRTHGHFVEGLMWCEHFLHQSQAIEWHQEYVSALHGTAVLLYDQVRYDRAREYSEKCLALCRAKQDQRGLAASLWLLGNIAVREQDYMRAQSLHTLAYEIRKTLPYPKDLADSLHALGFTYGEGGDAPKARSWYEQSLVIRRTIGDRQGTASTLNNLMLLWSTPADLETAFDCGVESLHIRYSLQDKRGIGQSLMSFASLARAQEQWKRMVILYEAAMILYNTIGLVPPPYVIANQTAHFEEARSKIGDAQAKLARYRGQSMTLDEAREYAWQNRSD